MKSEMKKLFDPDSKLMTAIGILGDHFLLSLLWLVCALPVITVGAGSAAMCKVSAQILDTQDRRLLRDFFGAVKNYFKAATKIWLAILALGITFVIDFYFYLEIAGKAGFWASVVLGVIGFVTVLFVVCLMWIYPYITRYKSKFLQAVKMSFLLGVMNLGWTVLMLVLDCALVLLGLYAAFLMPFVPGMITLANNLCIRTALRKYNQDPETQPEE